MCLSCVLGVVAQPLRRAETLVFFFWFLCGPFAARGGDGGSRVPRAFGWEVPVSIQWSASRGGGARDFDQDANNLAGRRKEYGTLVN